MEQQGLPSCTALQTALAARLCRAGRPVTAQTLADGLAVSRRSVQRALPGLERYLDTQGAALRRTPGVGLCLEADGGTMARLRRLTERGAPVRAGQEERRRRLLEILLTADRPIPRAQLREMLAVSDNTLRADLTAAQVWLTARGLTLGRCGRAGLRLLEDHPQRARALYELRGGEKAGANNGKRER